MKRLCNVILLSVISVSLMTNSSCGPGATPTPALPIPTATTSSLKPSWQQDWENILAAARKEGKVSLMSTLPPAAHGITGPFREKYGIDIEYFVGTVSELLPKVDAERRAGIHIRDVITGGLTPVMGTLAPQLEPMEPAFVLPEFKDVNIWTDKRLPFFDKEGKLFLFVTRVAPTIVVNKETVKPEEIKSWRNLLEPKWKGKILMFDPSIPGAGNALMAAVGEIMGISFLHELAKQEPVMNRDKRLQLEWVARGKYLVGIAFDFMLMEEMRAAGVPLAHVVPSTEGTWFGSGVGGIAMFNRLAHPNSTKVFLNWFLSKEGQTIFVKTAKEQSRRLDVAPEVAPDRLFQEGIKYVDGDSAYMVDKRNEMFELSKVIFAAQYK